jgi:hypothetical protein
LASSFDEEDKMAFDEEDKMAKDKILFDEWRHHRSAWVAGAESSEAAPNGTSRRRTPINAVAHAL